MDRNTTAPDVVVIGGGIAGLTAAFRLQRQGLSVTVLESADYAGGRMATIDVDGFRIDRAATVLFSCYDAMVNLIADADLGDKVVPASDLLGIVQRGGTLHTHTADRTDLSLFKGLSLRARAQLVRLSLNAMWHGKSLDWTVTPQAARLDNLDVRSFGHRWAADLNHGILDPLIRGFTLRETDGISLVQLYFVLSRLLGTRWFNSVDGIRFLPLGLAAKLDVRLEHEVLSIVEHPNKVLVSYRNKDREETIEASAAVVTAPPPQALPLLPGICSDRRELLSSIGHIPAIVVHLGTDRPPKETAAWLVLQREIHGPLNNVVLDHNKAPNRAPAGCGLTSLYWNGEWSRKHFLEDDNTVIRQGIEFADRLFPGLADQVRMAQVSRWPYHIATYPVGAFKRLDQLYKCDPTSRIRFASDFLGICGTTNTALAMGERAANEITQVLSSGK